MQRLFIVAGVILLVLGLAWPWLAQSGWWRWIGRLPGDIRLEREGFSFYFPLTTGIVISVVISVVVWFFRK